MRDIVATIQPDQDDIVRADAGQTVCVQGAPGTGKTAVGLHRVAYLLYAYREQVRRGGVVMVGPNRAFLSYIRNVLPALGEIDVTQTTVGELVAAGPGPRLRRRGGRGRQGRRADGGGAAPGAVGVGPAAGRGPDAAARLPALAGSRVRARGARRRARHRGVRYGAARELLEHRIAHVILTQMEAAGEACDDRTHESVRRSRPVRAAVEAIWPKVDPVRLVFGLLSSPAALAAAADGVLTDARAGRDRVDAGAARARLGPLVRGGPGAHRRGARPDQPDAEPGPRGGRRGAGPVADGVPRARPPVLHRRGHRARRPRPGHHAVGGASWAALLAHLGKPDTDVRELSVGYRVPRQILDYASSLLGGHRPRAAAGLLAARGPRGAGRRPGAAASLGASLAAACAQALRRAGIRRRHRRRPAGPRAGPRARRRRRRSTVRPARTPALTLVPVTMAKGLEFDHVIVVEPARIARAEARGLQRLYVALTRAVSRLTVLHSEPLPAALPPEPALHQAPAHAGRRPGL